MSLAKGAEFPQPKTAHANMSKLLRDQQNKQKQMREDIKVSVELSHAIHLEFLRRK